MPQHRRFLDLELNDDGLRTSAGTFELSEITEARVVRHREREKRGKDPDSYPRGVVGGALLGGAIGGPVGFLGGALLGGAAGSGDTDYTSVPRTVSATVTFESPRLAFSVTVDRDQVEEAEAFVRAVKSAAGLT